MASQEIQVNGITVHIEGQGPRTVLMLDGWPDTLRVWDGTVQALQPHHRCVRLTSPGFGTTDGAAPTPTGGRDGGLVAGRYQRRQPRRACDTAASRLGLVSSAMNWPCAIRSGWLPSWRWTSVITTQVLFWHHFLSVKSCLSPVTSSGWRQHGSLAAMFMAALADRMTRLMARTMRCPVPPDQLRWTMNFATP